MSISEGLDGVHIFLKALDELLDKLADNVKLLRWKKGTSIKCPHCYSTSSVFLDIEFTSCSTTAVFRCDNCNMIFETRGVTCT